MANTKQTPPQQIYTHTIRKGSEYEKKFKELIESKKVNLIGKIKSEGEVINVPGDIPRLTHLDAEFRAISSAKEEAIKKGAHFLLETSHNSNIVGSLSHNSVWEFDAYKLSNKTISKYMKKYGIKDCIPYHILEE